MSVPDDDILSIVFRGETLGQSYAQVAMTMGVTRSAIGGTVKRVRDAKAQAEAARLTDLQIKLMLDRMFLGKTAAEVIAKDFARAGVALNRMAVLYLVWSVMNDLHDAGDDLTTRPDTAEAVDWPAWWRRAQLGGVAA